MSRPTRSTWWGGWRGGWSFDSLVGLLLGKLTLWLLTKGDQAWKEAGLMTAAVRNLQCRPFRFVGCLSGTPFSLLRHQNLEQVEPETGGVAPTPGPWADWARLGYLWTRWHLMSPGKSATDQPSHHSSRKMQVIRVCGCFLTPPTRCPHK